MNNVLTDRNRCDACSSLFSSGEFDWILTDITQVEEYRIDTAAVSISGVNGKMIEDRAAYLFWRYALATSKAEKSILSRDTEAAFYDSLELPQINWFEPVIGSVSLLKVEENDSVAFASVKITYSAANQKGSLPANRKMHIYLQKTRGLKVDYADNGCSQCGAPIAEDTRIRCDYCNEPLPLKASDWLLTRLSK